MDNSITHIIDNDLVLYIGKDKVYLDKNLSGISIINPAKNIAWGISCDEETTTITIPSTVFSVSGVYTLIRSDIQNNTIFDTIDTITVA